MRLSHFNYEGNSETSLDALDFNLLLQTQLHKA
jgi:hypothetical protein